MLLFLAPLSGIIAAVVFGITVYFSRFVSLGSILGTLSAPFSVYFLGYNSSLIICLTIIFFLITIMHKENISRLLQGTENKV
ncbi:MAG: glycerol-3-phosphate acyltransferase, partial [Nitrospinae bacterium]|nr:glycerol-3-phosphate acyltransferase [Nitrospinota bacterium]